MVWSQVAWQRGDKKRAKELSDLKKAEKANVEQYNRLAARAIFRENNAHRDEYTIDLHGLFVKVKKINQKYCVKGCENSSTRVLLGQEDQATGRGERFMEPWKKCFK